MLRPRWKLVLVTWVAALGVMFSSPASAKRPRQRAREGGVPLVVIGTMLLGTGATNLAFAGALARRPATLNRLDLELRGVGFAAGLGAGVIGVIAGTVLVTVGARRIRANRSGRTSLTRHR